jgi:hypothetical protein
VKHKTRLLFLGGFSLTLLVVCAGGQKLESLTNAFQPVSKLVQNLRAYRSQIPGMPRETAQGYPVPVTKNGHTELAFLFFLQKGSAGKPPELNAPAWVVFEDARTGDFQVERHPENLDKAVGVHQLDPALTYSDLVKKQQELFTLFDDLLPFAGHYPTPIPPAVREKITRFRRIWKEISQKPLGRYYRDLNPEWFKFIES